MKRLLKLLLGLLATLLLLLLAATVLLPLAFDTDDLKRTVEQQVRDRTGRSLAIQGDLDLSFWPWLAVETSNVQLGQPAGFGDEPFLVIGEVRVGVALMPLLRRELVVDRVQLKGLDLGLQVSEDGIGNWEDLASAAASPADAPPAQQGQGFQLLAIGGLELRDSALSYRDARTGTNLALSDIQLEATQLDRLLNGEPLTVSLALTLEDRAAGTEVQLEASTDLVAASPNGPYRLTALEAKLTQDASLAELSADVQVDLEAGVHQLSGLVAELSMAQEQGDLRATVRGEVTADTGQDRYTVADARITAELPELPELRLVAPELIARVEAETLSLSAMNLQFDALTVEGSLEATDILSEPTFSGQLTAPPFDPKALMAALQLPPLETTDSTAATQLAFSAQVSGDADHVVFQNLEAALDESRLQGTLSARGFADSATNPAIRFDLTLDQMDLDRYLPPGDESGGSSDTESESGEATVIPDDVLDGLDVNGSLRADSLRLLAMDLTDARLDVQVADQRLRLHPLTAQFLGGTYQGDIRLDLSGDTPVVSLDERVESVLFQQLASDLFGYDDVSGLALASFQATGTGRTVDDLIASLGGRLALQLDEGALEGIDVWYEIRAALAKFKGKPLPETNLGRTVFSRLQLDADIVNGVIRTDQLAGQLPFLNLDGSGTIDLTRLALDLGLSAAVRNVPELAQDPLAGDLRGRSLPLRISGSIDAPRVAVDVEQLLKHEATNLLLDRLGLSGASEDAVPAEGETAGEGQAQPQERDAREEAVRGLFNALLGGRQSQDETAEEDTTEDGEESGDGEG